MSWVDAVGPIMGGLGSLFGSSPEYQMSPAEAWRLRMSRRMFNEARGRVPNPMDEGFADANAWLTEQAGQMTEGLFASEAGGYGDTSAAQGDTLSRLQSMLLSQRAGLASQMMQAAVAHKKSDMYATLGAAPQGGGFVQPGTDLSGAFGALGRMAGYSQGLGQARSPERQDPTPGYEVGPAPPPGSPPGIADQLGMAPTVQTQPAPPPNPYGSAYSSGSTDWWSRYGRQRAGGSF